MANFIAPLEFITLSWLGLWLLKMLASNSIRLIEHLLMPLERWAFQWLQDRATARTLGIDIEIIRVRRKSEFPKTHRLG